MAQAVGAPPDVEKRSQKETDELIRRISDRYDLATSEDAENRQRQESDTKFVYEDGASWPLKTRREREANGDPCMTFPQLRQFVSQVVNEQRQQRPGIHVYALDEGEKGEETAELLQGLIRGIERDSRAEAVYDWGYQHTVLGGRGWWRIISEYESGTSFNQNLVIQRIADPLSVRADNAYVDPDGGDREWLFIDEKLTIKEFKSRWPNAQVVEWTSDSKWTPSKDEIVIADYYERKVVQKRLLQLVTGEVGFADDLEKQYQGQMPPIAQERMADTHKVCWYKVAGGNQILEEYDWPGEIIPVVCSVGDEVIIDGKRHFMGLIHQARDTQTLFDFGMTQQAVTLSLTPRAPFIGTAEAIEGHEHMWKTANTANWSTLVYNAFRKDGTPIPPPIRTQASMIDSGWLNWTQQMTGLMRSVVGLYENSLGMRGQEVSGRAILAREQQGDNATFHFIDNFSRAIALTGRILLECIPTYYDTQRIVTIVGEDDEAKPQQINQAVPNPQNPTEDILLKDVTTGKFAVRVEAGKGYATKRKEMAELTMEMVKAFPQIMQFAGDLIVRVQDIPEADQLAERMKAMLPPQVTQMLAAKEAGQNPEVAQAQAQIQQLTQQLQEMSQQGQMLTQQLEQIKADKSASVAASNARQAQAEASTQNEAQSQQFELQKAFREFQLRQEELEIRREAEREKAQNARDKLMIDMFSKLADHVLSAQQVAQTQQVATDALDANP